MATYQGKLVEHGSAPYQDNPEKNISYFAKLEYADGRTEKVWGVGLQDALQNSNVKEGDNVVLNNYDNKSVTIPDPNDPTKNITTKRNQWSVDLYEPYQNLTNEIAQDKEVVRQKTAEKIAKEAEEAWEGKTKKSVQDFDYLPDNIKNNYVGIVKNKNMSDEKINYYDKDDKGQVNIAFEDRKETLNTSRQDAKTVHAMLDLAESRGWTAISLKGTEEFKQKAWLEASLRGIETSGYKPTERDEAMLEAKQKERNFNTVVAETIEEPTHTRTESEQAPPATDNQEQEQNQNQAPAEPTVEAEEREGEQQVEEESYIRSEEFNNGRDLGDDDVTLKADIERFGDNLAAPTGKTETQEAARQRVEAAFERKVDKTDREIKQEIRTLLQNGVRDGSIKDRSDIVEQLKERGFEVVRENEKSITLSNPNGKDIRLEGEMFTKNYDAFKSLNDSLKPDTLKEKYPQISDENIAKIELWRQDVFSRYNTMEARQNGLSRLNSVVPDVASGKLDLGQPKIPANEIKPDMDIRTLDKGEQTRSR